MSKSSSQLRKDRLRLLTVLEEFFLEHLTSPFARQTYFLYKATVADTARYLSLSQDETGKFSYAENKNDRFANRRRRRTTLARYIRRQMEMVDSQFPDKYLTELQNYVVAKLFDATQFIQIVTGEAIREAYDNKFGGESCMTGRSYVNFYVINPEKVALLKYDNGLKQARSLLWTTDQNVKVLDRIYPTDNGAHIAILQAWAHKQGFRVAFQDKCSDLTVTMIHENEFPFLDNFYYGRYLSNGKILLGTTSATGDLKFQSTEGGLVEENYYSCNSCEEGIDEEDAYSYHGNYYCHSCWEEYFFCCFECESDFHQEDGIYIDGHAGHICRTCAGRLTVHCSVCNSQILTADAVQTTDGNHHCQTCLIQEGNREAV